MQKIPHISIPLKTLITSDVCVGHQINNWNPRTSYYLYGIKQKKHILDLEIFILCMRRALNFIKTIQKMRGEIIFIQNDTKKRHKVNLFQKRFLKKQIIPQAIVLLTIDPILVKQAIKYKIPVISILDSNENPYGITYPIPSNNDNNKILELYLELFKQTDLYAKKIQKNLLN